MYETAHRAPSGDNLGRCRPKRSEADALRPSRNFLTLRIAPNSIVGRVQRQFSCFGTTSSLLLPLFTFCLSERSLWHIRHHNSPTISRWNPQKYRGTHGKTYAISSFRKCQVRHPALKVLRRNKSKSVSHVDTLARFRDAMMRCATRRRAKFRYLCPRDFLFLFFLFDRRSQHLWPLYEYHMRESAL